MGVLVEMKTLLRGANQELLLPAMQSQLNELTERMRNLESRSAAIPQAIAAAATSDLAQVAAPSPPASPKKENSRQTATEEAESAASKADHIWFLETSGRRKLKPREACSIESACRHNTDYTVHLLYTGNISSNHCPYLRVLSKLPNFRSAVVNAGTELSGTPLSRFYEKGGELRRSKHFVEHLSDFLRYAVIWKRGGIYLDSDIIVLKSLKGIHNSVLFEDKGNTVTNCLLCFTRNHPAIGALMDACSRQYSRDVWTSCSLALMSRLPLDAVFSRRVNFLESWTFCSFFYSHWRYFFDPKMAEQVLKAVNRSYGVHIWNKLSTRTVTVVGSGSAMDRLARAHCPSAYSAAASAGYF
ncbi:lactosylceramide 4-alpha-galactosyltransferase-like [Rhipicephalus microplus]|uniref:lactosylceramide 4-alpha-galactosyltransferase-like n=1 Tax=Rhipicephalus microplus TaxID=6941 RepID=UPI003F6AAEB3